MPNMTDEELRGRVDYEIEQSAAWMNTDLAADRERNLDYYHGKPIGNEVEGRSQVVSWDVFEVVETALPYLVEPFFAGDEIGEFEPTGIEDEQYSEQATDYVNYLIKKKNDGFLLFQTWVKDGLLSKVGIVRSWWDTRKHSRKESYRGLTDEQLTEMVERPNVKLITHDATPDPDDEKLRKQAQEQMKHMPPEQAQQMIQQMMQQPPKMLHDIEIEIDLGEAGITIDSIPPESFILSRRAKRMKDATIVGELRRYHRSDLVEMGYDRTRIDDLSDYSADSMDMQATVDLGLQRDSGAFDGSLDEVVLFFGFIKVDYDNDGVAEWRRLFMGGNDILENTEVNDHEYSIWTPILLPHTIIGMAYADPLVEIQNLKTTLTRQYLDSLYAANNPATYAIEGRVNLDDLLSSRINRVIRMKDIGAAGAMQTTVVANESLQGIELAEKMRENRLGVTQYTQGIDSESLNQTAHGIERIMSAGEKRLLMTLRIFAETGVKDLFKKVLRLTCEYQDKPATIKLRNKWVEYDPRNWSSEMDVTVNVGLGAGDKATKLMQLSAYGQFMQTAASQGVVTPKQTYNFGKLMLKNMEIQGGVELLLNNPEENPQAPAKSPEQMLAEAQIQIAQIQQKGKDQDHQMRMQLDRAKLEADTVMAEMQIRLKEKEVRLKEIELGLKFGDTGLVADANAIPPLSPAEFSNAVAQLQQAVEALNNTAATIAQPKMIVRDQNGKAIGVQPVPHQPPPPPPMQPPEQPPFQQ